MNNKKTIDWSEEFNALDYKTRLIGSSIQTQTRIQHLIFEKNRIKKRYTQSMKEINEYIKNCEKHLKENEDKIKKL